MSDNQNSLGSRRKKPKRRRILWIIVSTLLVLGVGAIAWGVRTWYTTKTTMNQTYQATGMSKARNVDEVLAKKKPISILLLGTDTGALGRDQKSFVSRTDTMILATLNPNKETMTLTSIPRDTLVIVDGQAEKINAAYTLGGAGGAINATQKLLKVPVDFYALINMGGLKQLINAMGGVTLTPKLTFKYGHANVKKGVETTLNGAEALDYARMRHDDPLGDYGRQKRQKQVIKALVSQSSSLKSVVNMSSIAKQLAKNMRTDLSFDDMVTMNFDYRVATHHTKSYTLQGEDEMLDGLSYQVATADARYKTSRKIRTALQLDADKWSSDDFSSTATISTK
ncbi:LCP family protein [Levilactobacillus brevis]|uniref:LCP family protein n=1 Tax=Levilactobacillus brevis TaxID=1580 RepID=UPI0011195B98|nr:LCP family protein [Levilactobacillus brevis]QCZ46840.1 hypothetical protein UCCLB556_1965 [Levilactobacillus brevis]